MTAQTGAQVKIGSQITGRIRRLYADVGSSIKAGNVIAELDLPDITAQVQQAEASLASSRLRLAQQQSGQTMQRTQTQSGVADAKAALNSARARLNAAEAAAKQQGAQNPTDIRRAETSLNTAQGSPGLKPIPPKRPAENYSRIR